MMRRKFSLLLLAACCSLGALAQINEDYYVPLYTNYKIKQHRKYATERVQFQGKRGVTDTLTLPFFEDFSEISVLPLESRWTDGAVYINADFPINPPSIGVATFDGLDGQGNAYEGIDPSFFGSADTLSSQPIDLSGFMPGDSLYLSFFYQAQGLSFEVLKASDSLVLQFQNRIGAWVNVWSSPGLQNTDFHIANVAVKDTSYLHDAFRFRWMNFQQYIGNLKQWHLDYVYMNQGRNFADTVFEDQAMVYLPPYPFSNFTHVPWKHVQKSFSKYLRTGFEIPVSNMANSGETFTVSMRVNDNADVVGFSSLSGQSLPANGITNYNLSPNIQLFTNLADSSKIRLVSYLGDILGGNDVKGNDSAVREVELANYYAYDDGTAESGYGILNSNGSVACGFDSEMGDSLRGVWIHFTQAERAVKTGFALTVWKKIAPVGQPSANLDQIIYSAESMLPVYTDTINGFHLYLLDSAVFVNGKFYVGWEQSSSFLLNIGLDRNYTFNGASVPNPNIYYNVSGQWRNSTVPGTIMIRPVVGEQWPDPTALNHPLAKKLFTLFPNPATASFSIQSEESFQAVYLLDGRGQTVKSWINPVGSFALDNLAKGVYFVRINWDDQQWSTEKLIIH